MSEKGFIYVDKDYLKKDKSRVSIHYLVGYNQGTIKDFISMAEKIKKQFPSIKIDDVCGGKIFKSSHADGFTIVEWSGTLTKDELKNVGRFHINHSNPEYCWRL